MKKSELKIYEGIVEKCRNIEKKEGVENAWDYLIDTIYDISNSYSTEFFNKLWKLDEEYKEKFVEENTF